MIHTEHFYYDGARRVQEVFHSLDAGSASEQSSEDEQSIPTLSTWADREYVHTAGPGSYVDEFVCEISNLASSQTPYFHLQDANYTVVGLVNAAGAVVRQHTFDAYGRLIHAEDFATTLKSRVGHQGLFFTRLDAPQGWPELSVTQVAAGTGGAAPLTVPVAGLYHTHNRSYSPELGRWLQGDPNGTGMLVLGWRGWHGGRGLGTQMRLGLVAAGPVRLFQDGACRYAHVTNNPMARVDALGLDGSVSLSGQSFMSGMAAFVQSMFGGVANLGASLSGLTTTTGAWAVNTIYSAAGTATLVVGYNPDVIGQLMAAGEANGPKPRYSLSDLIREATGAGRAAPQPPFDPEKMTESVNRLAERLGVTPEQVKQAIHVLKSRGAASGGQSNPDVWVNYETGAAYIKGTTEYLGNILDQIAGW